MIPGSYTLTIVENATNTYSFVISGITTATGYTAAIDFRDGETADDTLLLGLTSSSGIALSSNGSSLTVAVTITEAQTDTLVPYIEAGAFWSLKISVSSTSLQYLAGAVKKVRTPTE